ncbi:MAG TPA: 50S ribosomal protein L30e [Thermoplasmata archaeon]|jgi:large subunit ribosomal protein L30e|nr:MAG TPA: 50S ribosomal protein L30e [Thermoplasmata archaeon]
MVDVNKALKDVAKKGTIIIGEKQTKASIKKGTAKLVVMANNCPYAQDITALVAENKIPVYNYTSTGVDLGYTCGKNYAVASFAVLQEGESNILALVKKRK